jgi:hypothetical protein
MKHSKAFVSFLVLAPALSLALGACTGMSRAERAQARLEEIDLYVQNAGEPISSFNFLGRLEEWHNLDDNRLVVRTSFNDAYLIKVMGPCHELSSVLTVGLTSRGGFVGLGDSVIAGRDRCPITEIRPVDYKAVREAKRLAAKERKEARAAEQR